MNFTFSSLKVKVKSLRNNGVKNNNTVDAWQSKAHGPAFNILVNLNDLTLPARLIQLCLLSFY